MRLRCCGASALRCGEPRRDQLLLQLSRELAVHASLEEKVLYAQLRDGAASHAKVLDALKHHERIHELLFDLVVMRPDESAWRKMFAQLADVIAQYVEHEEAELFPLGRQLISPLQRRRMTRDLLAEQRRLTGGVGSHARPWSG
jgi:hypothetical protein